MKAMKIFDKIFFALSYLNKSSPDFQISDLNINLCLQLLPRSLHNLLKILNIETIPMKLVNILEY